MQLPDQVLIKEVGPRDGLQNEKEIIGTRDKISWINALSKTGMQYIEATSFVHPGWIPQLRDAEEVMKGIERNKNVTYAALVPNNRGLERALKAEVDEISVFMSASEEHNRKNINKSIKETFQILAEVVKTAKQEKKQVRGYVSTVFGCPYKGEVPLEDVFRVADSLLEMGIDELSLGDTIGVATPLQVKNLLFNMKERFPIERLAMHFHDTRGAALANVLMSLMMGIRTFDSSTGGLGGCPYARGATGNLATDDLLYMLEGMGIHTGIHKDKLLDAAILIQGKLCRPLESKQMQIWNAHQEEKRGM